MLILRFGGISYPTDQNVVSEDSLGSDPRSSREAINIELAGKLGFDDHRVFQRLGVDQPPATLVDACAESLLHDPNIQHARGELKAVIASAPWKSDLELEEEANQYYDGTAEEMYRPLVCYYPTAELGDSKNG